MSRWSGDGGPVRVKGTWYLPVLLVTVVACVGVTVLASSASPASSSALRRYPYTNEVVGSSATVSWATDRSQSTGAATWGPVSNGQCAPTNAATATRASITVGSTSEYQWTATLPFGAAGTYCYRVQLGGIDLLGSDPSPQITTAAPPGSPFSFAVVGDWGAGTTAEANVMSRIGESPASFVVTTGDNVYNSGTETEYGDLTQGNVFPSQYLRAIGSKPFFVAEGNHGFSTNLPYLQNFPAPTAAATSGGRYRQESYCCVSTMSGTKTYPSSWYAFDWGGTRFYVLEAAWADSQGGYQGDFLGHWNGPVAGCGPCGAELTWLQNDLAAHPGALKFAFFHYPLYSDSGSQTSDTYLSGQSHLEGLLASNNVGVIFNGHAHHYQRNYPQIPGQALVSYITGGGGAALGSVSSCSAFDAYAIGSNSSCRAPKPASSANVYHFLLVSVNGNQVTVTPTDSTGKTFDVQTYTFSGSTGGDTTPPTAPNLTAAATGSSSVGLTWTASTDDSGVTSYAITRDGSPLTSVPGTVTSFTDTTVAPGTTYAYRVRALDAAGNSSPDSNPATVSTPPAPSGGATFTFGPTDDAYVDQMLATSNFGSSSRIVTDQSPVNDALVKFQVATGNCSIASATLSLTVGTSSSDGSTKGGDLHTTATTNWSENTVTWSDAPAANAATIASLGAVTGGTTYKVVVTPAVTGDGAVSFRLNSSSTDGARYFSKEASTTQAPQLVVTCADPAPAMTSASTTGSTTTVTSSSTFPIRAAFYYPWFPEAWNQGGISPYTWYNPSLGLYDTSNPVTTSTHIAEMQYAGLNTGIASWWGQSSRTNSRVASLLQAASTTAFRWTLYYEPEGMSDPTVSQIDSDLSYIAANYASNPSFLYVGGRPVIFVYGDTTDDCSMVDRWTQANRSRFYVVLKVVSGHRQCTTQPDGWHQYAPAVRADSQDGSSYSVSPGFWLRSESTPRLSRDTAAFAFAVQAMVASNAPFQLVTTFNEWGEGTAVESAQEWESFSTVGNYLDILHQYLNGAPA